MLRNDSEKWWIAEFKERTKLSEHNVEHTEESKNCIVVYYRRPKVSHLYSMIIYKGAPVKL